MRSGVLRPLVSTLALGALALVAVARVATAKPPPNPQEDDSAEDDDNPYGAPSATPSAHAAPATTPRAVVPEKDGILFLD
ncbi:MAG: hypothetical protein ACLP8S_32695 [Solirubrobacteraceae bacterium]